MGLRKNSEKEYEDQESLNTFATPEGGAYVVVGTGVRRIETKNNAKVRLTLHVLQGVKLDSGGEKNKYDGKKFGIDLWWDLKKQYNEQRLAFLIRACHEGEVPESFLGEGDTFDDTDKNLVMALTGVPFGIKIACEERGYTDKDGNKKTSIDVRVIESKNLNDKALKKFTKDPDFKEIIGEAKERLLEAKPYEGQRGGGESGGGSDDSWASDPDDPGATDDGDDEDLPF